MAFLFIPITRSRIFLDLPFSCLSFWHYLFCTRNGGKFLEHDNFFQADPMKTPPHIAPVWYFTPYYAILRAIPDKLMGVIGMGLAIAMFFLVPWLDRCKVKSIRYRGPLCKIHDCHCLLWHFLGLGFLGMQPVTPLYTILSRLFNCRLFCLLFADAHLHGNR